jgi:hypothetical protein
VWPNKPLAFMDIPLLVHDVKNQVSDSTLEISQRAFHATL